MCWVWLKSTITNLHRFLLFRVLCNLPPPPKKKKVCRLKGLPGPQKERLVSESPFFRGSFSAWGAGGMPGM